MVGPEVTNYRKDFLYRPINGESPFKSSHHVWNCQAQHAVRVQAISWTKEWQNQLLKKGYYFEQSAPTSGASWRINSSGSQIILISWDQKIFLWIQPVILNPWTTSQDSTVQVVGHDNYLIQDRWPRQKSNDSVKFLYIDSFQARTQIKTGQTVSPMKS